MKDIANIYEFDEEFKKKYVKNLWQDARPGMEPFAKKIKEQIRNMGTPSVVVLEGSFGEGKTFFLTRFCEYLKQKDSDNKNMLQSIYLNLWKSDYNPDPLSVIGGQILSELYRDEKSRKKSKLGRILKSLILQGGVNMGVFYIQIRYLPPKEREKNVLDFKNELQKLISEKKENIVLIVDELDRCNPHYAVKTLQVIKHFFDIEGLIVILSSTMSTLEQIFEGYYGFKQNQESYVSKFVNRSMIFDISSLQDYEDLIEKYIKVPKISDRDDCGESNDREKDFVKAVSKIFYDGRVRDKEGKTRKMSVREILKILDKWNFAMQCFNWLEYKDKNYEKNLCDFPKNVFYAYLEKDNNLSLGQEPELNFNPNDYYFKEDALNERRNKINEIAEKIYRL
jgi:hypothetical protein